MKKKRKVGGFTAGLNVHLPKNIIFMNSNHILTGLNNFGTFCADLKLKSAIKRWKHEKLKKQQKRKCNQWKIWMTESQKWGWHTHVRAHALTIFITGVLVFLIIMLKHVCYDCLVQFQHTHTFAPPHLSIFISNVILFFKYIYHSRFCEIETYKMMLEISIYCCTG